MPSPFKWYSDDELEEEVELPTEDESREAAKPVGCRQSALPVILLFVAGILLATS